MAALRALRALPVTPINLSSRQSVRSYASAPQSSAAFSMFRLLVYHLLPHVDAPGWPAIAAVAGVVRYFEPINLITGRTRRLHLLAR